jgi:hypothetical protein
MFLSDEAELISVRHFAIDSLQSCFATLRVLRRAKRPKSRVFPKSVLLIRCGGACDRQCHVLLRFKLGGVIAMDLTKISAACFLGNSCHSRWDLAYTQIRNVQGRRSES